MPGVYTKNFHGPRYEATTSLILECEALLKKASVCDVTTNLSGTWPKGESCRELVLILPAVLLRQGDYSKELVEEFCVAGGFRLLFSILQQGARRLTQVQKNAEATLYEKSQWEILIRTVLNNLSSLLAVEFLPFDDDIPAVPLLVYFLCERHTHYVDINWSPEELTLMREFLTANFAVLTARESAVPPDLKLLALNVLHTALFSFPAHRVVPACAEVFSKKECTRIIAACETLRESQRSIAVSRRILQLYLSIGCFGLGYPVVAGLSVAQSLLTANSLIMPSVRCPCQSCEFFRKLQRCARDSDQFGVPAAAYLKRMITENMVAAGLYEALSSICATELEHWRAHPVTMDACAEPAQGENGRNLRRDNDKNSDGVDSQNVDGENQIDISDSAAAEKSNAYVYLAPKDELFLSHEAANERVESDTITTTATVCSEEQFEEKEGDSIVIHKGSTLFELRDHVCLLVALCTVCFSFASERSDEESRVVVPLSTLVSLLRLAQYISAEYIVKTRRYPHGKRRAMEAVALLIGRMVRDRKIGDQTSGFDSIIDSLRTSAVTEALAIDCENLPLDITYSLPFHAMALTLTQIKNHEQKSGFPTVVFDAYQRFLPLLMHSIANGLSLLDSRAAIMALLQCMAALTNAPEVFRCTSELRRRYLPPPDSRCGFIIQLGRDALEFFNQRYHTVGCAAVRNLSSMSIYLAEKSVGLIPIRGTLAQQQYTGSSALTEFERRKAALRERQAAKSQTAQTTAIAH